jgi:hypothetical protein
MQKSADVIKAAVADGVAGKWLGETRAFTAVPTGPTAPATATIVSRSL